MSINEPDPSDTDIVKSEENIEKMYSFDGSYAHAPLPFFQLSRGCDYSCTGHSSQIGATSTP